ncbi:MAG: peptide-binding protein [Campylobacterota bacterium]|nr:peptide-binding protein [Campylobacterota bacterium]
MKFLFITLFLISSTFASTLNLSISSNPSRINPILATDSASSEIADWIFNGLFKYDKNAKVVPNLAQSYEFIDDVTLIIKLKKDVRWHDGVGFEAKDVLFTYNTILSPKVFIPSSASYKKVKSLEVVDKYTIKIIYKEPYFKALEIWMIGILPEHLLKDEEDLMRSDFNKNPIGTGPYKLNTFKISSDIKLIANSDYFEGRPNIDEILYKFLPDPTTSFLMLKQQLLDLGGLTPIQIDRQIDQTFKTNYKIVEKPSFGYTYMGFNLKRDKFKDIRIRQALSLAIDRQEMVDILFFGHGKTCNGPFLPGTFAFNEKVELPTQDIQKAKALLKELGYTKNNPFSFELVTNANNSIRVNAAQIMQYQLEKIGVKMKIRVMEWQAFLNTIVHPRNFDAILLGWGLSLMPDAYSLWHSKSDKKGGFNLVGYHNSEVDKLIDLGSKTVDREKLGSIYKQIFAKISQELPYLFLYIPNSITVVNSSIKNIEPTFIGIMHNQKDWIKE